MGRGCESGCALCLFQCQMLNLGVLRSLSQKITGSYLHEVGAEPFELAFKRSYEVKEKPSRMQRLKAV